MGVSSDGVTPVAKIEMTGLDDYIKKLTQLGVSVEGTIKRAAYPAAGMVIEALKAACPADTGSMRDSMALVRYTNQNGYVYTQVVFEGYDEKGVANALKANVIESGSSKQRKQPFIRPTVNRVKAQAEAMIASEFEKIVEEKMNQ